MKAKYFFMASAALALTLTSCEKEEWLKPFQHKNSVTEENQEKDSIQTDTVNGNYNINIGDTLTISLESNPTTGYSWVLDTNASNEVAEVVAQEFIAPQVAGGMLGVPGAEIIHILGKKSGMQELTFNYVRSWELGVAPIKVQKVIVEVK